MKRKIKFLVYLLTVILVSLFVIVGCSDDDDDIIDENLPSLTTTEVTSITQTTAKSGGNITDDGGAAVTARGVIWSTSANLTVNNNEGITVDGAGAGSFTSNITDLEPETQYYVRAYATNSHGTGYGNALAFKTLEETTGTVTDIDGNVYQTVIIGNQEWMAENLRVTKYNNGDAIPTGLSNTEWQYTTNGAYAIYPHEGGDTEDDVEGINSDAEMVAAYGKRYNWFAVNTGNLCPEGWSVPSDDDWTALVNYVVSEGFPIELGNPNGAGNALKSCRQVNSPLGGDCDTDLHPRWNSDDTHYGFDEFGFSALTGGLRHTNGSYILIGRNCSWWSSSETSSTDAWHQLIVSIFGSVSRTHSDKRFGFSVRCFRDIDN